MNAIFVEAGHGKSPLGLKDNGASGTYKGQKVFEREYAKSIARAVLSFLAGKLENYIVQGVGVETDASTIAKMRYVNTVISENRYDPSKSFGVAIHMNSGPKEANGWEIWYQKSGKSLNFANSIGESLKKYNVVSPRSKPINSSADGRYRRFYIDDTLVRYVIVEVGFISNLDDAQKIWENSLRVGESIAHGILEHIRNL